MSNDSIEKIIIDKQHLQAQKITVNPDTFEPEIVVVIDEQYWNEVSKTSQIHKSYVDYSHLNEWVDEHDNCQAIRAEINFPNVRIVIGKFMELDENSYNFYTLSKWIDGMYNIDNSYILPVVMEVTKK